MKKKISSLTSLLLMICTHGFADTITQQPKPLNETCPNHIYFGAEIFLFDMHTHVRWMEVYGLNVFAGPEVRYEYRKPKAFYAGIDLLGGWSPNGLHGKYNRLHSPKNNSNIGFGNLELRLGYTFGSASKMFSPFVGIGAYAFGNCGNYFHYSQDMFYYTFGMRSLFEVNHGFSIGVNWKIFRTADTKQKFEFLLLGSIVKLTSHDDIWGGEVGVPFVWYVGSAKKWEIQLEPYFLKLNFSKIENIYGTRLLFGYRF